MKQLRFVAWTALLGGIVFYLYLKYNAPQFDQQRLAELSEEHEDEFQGSEAKPRTSPVKSVLQSQRLTILHQACENFGHVPWHTKHITTDTLESVYVVDSHKLLYCGISHAGDTNWKKIALVLSGYAASVNDISSVEADSYTEFKRLNAYSPFEALNRLYNYTNMVFVRDPMERLVSAFHEMGENHAPSEKEHSKTKFVPLSKADNTNAMATGTDPFWTFQEFVEHVLSTTGQENSDWHWRPYYKVCYPCLIRYNFIGKLETLQSDAAELLSLINAPKGLIYPSTAQISENTVKNYLAQLPHTMQQALHNIYYNDYLLFGYPLPEGVIEE